MLHNHYETTIFNDYPIARKNDVIALSNIITETQASQLKDGETVKLSVSQSIRLSVELFGLEGQWQW